MNHGTRFAAIATTVALLALTPGPVRAAVEYSASAGLSFTYSDVQTVATPAAHVEGNTSPGSEWIAYDATGDAGAIHAWLQLYSCCVNNAGAGGHFKVDDLVFASPGGTGGTATVSVNLFVNAAIGGCHGGNFKVRVQFGTQLMEIGNWEAGGPSCSGGTSTGIFTGIGGSSVSGYFTSPTFEVPLDEPITFMLSSGVGLGSYQQVVTMDSYAAFVPPASGQPVFNIVSGPQGVTANSAQANVSNNAWTGGAALAVGEPPRGGTLMLGPPSPNPSSGPASFTLSLPTDAHVTVAVYDVRGSLVDVMQDGRLAGGVHRLAWDARRANAPAGIYFVKLAALGRNEMRRLAIVR